MRGSQRSCLRCIAKKRKCDHGDPVCSSCVKAGVRCEYPPDQQRRGPIAGTTRVLDNRIDELERALGFLLGIDQVRGILDEMASRGVKLPKEGWMSDRNREERLEWIESHPLRDIRDLLDYSRPTIPREIGPHDIDAVPDWSRTGVTRGHTSSEQPAQPRGKSPSSQASRRPKRHRHQRASSSGHTSMRISTSPGGDLSALDHVRAAPPGPSHDWMGQETSVEQPEPNRNEHGAQQVDEQPVNSIGDLDRGADLMGYMAEIGPVQSDPWLAMSTSSGLTPPVNQTVQRPVGPGYDPPRLAASDLFW